MPELTSTSTNKLPVVAVASTSSNQSLDQNVVVDTSMKEKKKIAMIAKSFGQEERTIASPEKAPAQSPAQSPAPPAPPRSTPKKKQFRARPMPDLTYKKSPVSSSSQNQNTPEKKRGGIIPKPFILRTEERSTMERISSPNKKVPKSPPIKKQFRARPMPDLTFKPPPQITRSNNNNNNENQKKKKGIIIPKPFRLRTEERSLEKRIGGSPVKQAKLVKNSPLRRFRARPMPNFMTKLPSLKNRGSSDEQQQKASLRSSQHTTKNSSTNSIIPTTTTTSSIPTTPTTPSKEIRNSTTILSRAFATTTVIVDKLSKWWNSISTGGKKSWSRYGSGIFLLLILCLFSWNINIKHTIHDSGSSTVGNILRNKNHNDQNHGGVYSSRNNSIIHVEKTQQHGIMINNTTTTTTTTTTTATTTTTTSNSIIQQKIQINKEETKDTVQFAILAFPKTATGFLRKNYLNISQTFWGKSDERELRLLSYPGKGPIQSFLHEFHQHPPPSLSSSSSSTTTTSSSIIAEEKKNGFKHPSGLYHPLVLNRMVNYFPNAKLIVSLRHPVLWFQSYYNFRNAKKRTLKKLPEELIGDCHDGCGGLSSPIDAWMNEHHHHINNNNTKNDDGISEGGGGGDRRRCLSQQEARSVCTGNANFHRFLSRLRLTPMNTLEEINLLFFYPPSTADDVDDNDDDGLHEDDNHDNSNIKQHEEPQQQQQQQQQRRIPHPIDHQSQNFTSEIFLMEVGQIQIPNPPSSTQTNKNDNNVYLQNKERTDQFSRDLEAFLELSPNTLDLEQSVSDYKSNQEMEKMSEMETTTQQRRMMIKSSGDDDGGDDSTDSIALRTSTHIRTNNENDHRRRRRLRRLRNKKYHAERWQINICDSQYINVRNELIAIGSQASDWIINFLLKSPRVVTSNTNYFIELLEQWKVDPCTSSIANDVGSGGGDTSSNDRTAGGASSTNLRGT